jgi:hypothetical protein
MCEFKVWTCYVKKIKSIKNVYRQELLKIEKLKKKSGVGADDVYKPKLAWFKRADIFLKNVSSRTTTSNLVSTFFFVTQFLILLLHSFIDQR